MGWHSGYGQNEVVGLSAERIRQESAGLASARAQAAAGGYSAAQLAGLDAEIAQLNRYATFADTYGPFTGTEADRVLEHMAAGRAAIEALTSLHPSAPPTAAPPAPSLVTAGVGGGAGMILISVLGWLLFSGGRRRRIAVPRMSNPFRGGRHRRRRNAGICVP